MRVSQSICFHSTFALYRGSGIIGPASVIQVELVDGRQWEEVVSKSGVVSYVSRIAKRAPAVGN